MDKCMQYEWENRKLKVALKLATSCNRQMKCQIRIDYEWDGEEANFADVVSSWVKTYLFPQYKLLKEGWMNYSTKPGSLLSFVQKKAKGAEGANYQEQWERVICPTIQAKYISIRCNLNNDIRKAYKGKS